MIKTNDNEGESIRNTQRNHTWSAPQILQRSASFFTRFLSVFFFYSKKSLSPPHRISRPPPRFFFPPYFFSLFSSRFFLFFSSFFFSPPQVFTCSLLLAQPICHHLNHHIHACLAPPETSPHFRMKNTALPRVSEKTLVQEGPTNIITMFMFLSCMYYSYVCVTLNLI